MNIYTRRRQSRSRTYLASTASLLFAISSSVTAQTSDENGPAQPSTSAGTMSVSGWYAGKLDPAVEAQAASSRTVSVIIYAQPPAEEVDPVAIGAQFNSSIDNLTSQLKDFAAQGRPSESLTEEEELAWMEQGSVNAPIDLRSRDRVAEQLDRTLSEKRKIVTSAVVSANRPGLEQVAAMIESNGGSVEDFIFTVNAVSAELPFGSIRAIADDPMVTLVVFNPPVEEETNNSVPSYNYDDWWNDVSDPTTGGFFDFGIAEGVDNLHPALVSHVFYEQPGTAESDHGTHVTGIVSSTDTIYRGGAYGHDAIISAQTGGNQAGVMQSMDWMVTTATQDPEVVNHSLGFSTVTSDYHVNDGFYDVFTTTYGVTVTKSAGNNGYSTLSPTITNPASAYNIFTVASIDDQDSTTRTDDLRSSFSSVGPTIGGRKKPTISAPGASDWSVFAGIMSTNSTWETGADFDSKGGTSMAAPHVAGAVLLMTDRGLATAREQKALLYQTADAVDSKNTSTTADDTAVAGDFWDKSYGYGRMDLAEATFQSPDVKNINLIANNSNNNDDDHKFFRGTMFSNDKATVVWYKRHTGYIGGSSPGSGYDLTNIVTYLYDGADGSIIDAELSFIDNVEQVTNDSGVSVDAVIKVLVGATIDGLTSEAVSVATEENIDLVSPPKLILTFVPNGLLFDNPDNLEMVDICVENTGGVPVHNATFSLTGALPAGFTSSDGSVNVGTVDTDDVVCHTYEIKVDGVANGTYNIPVQVSSTDYFETYSDADSLVAKVNKLCNGLPLDVDLSYGDTIALGNVGQVIGGTNAGETILADNGNDTVCGFDGYDKLYGQGGADTMFGGDSLGNDTTVNDLYGGTGDDILYGGRSNSSNWVYGQGSADKIYDGSILEGGSGNDVLDNTDFDNNSVMKGGGNNDEMGGSDQVDDMNGGPGLDKMWGFGGDDIMAGGNAQDTMYGGDGNDTMSGAAAKDTLFGEAGDDMLFGNSGNDTLDGGPHSSGDSCEGGSGTDTATNCELTGGIPAPPLLTQVAPIDPNRVPLTEEEVLLIDRCDLVVEECLAGGNSDRRVARR